MSFTEIALRMWPYWALGIFMLIITINSEYATFVRVEKSAVISWAKVLVFLSLYRIAVFKLFPGMHHEAIQKVSFLPWQSTLTVFWEDACHGLPLILLRSLIGTKWFTLPIHLIALLLIMASFGLGHTYQGNTVALCISAYIPFSMMIAKKRGFGTVMVNHTLYDISTVLTIKLLGVL